MAWVSSSEGSPVERFIQSAVPYRQLDGAEVASDWNDLIDGTLESGILLTETMGAPPKGTTTSCMLDVAFAWSGTQETGVGLPDGDCNDWSDGAGYGFAGWVGQTDNEWTVACMANCLDEATLYCFEQ